MSDSLKQAQRACLLMAALSLVTLAVMGAFVWIATSFPSQRAPKLDQPEFIAKVESTSSFESLKALCTNLASAYDVQEAHIAFLNRTTDEIVWRLAALLVGWAVVSAAGFLYVFQIIGRHSKE